MLYPFIKYFFTLAYSFITGLYNIAVIVVQNIAVQNIAFQNSFQKLAKESVPIRKTFFLILTFSLLMQLPAAYSKVIRLDQVDLGNKHYDYLYQWSDPDIKPKAIVIAIHGLTMHGLVYDGLAKHLAQEGIIVLAPDLPGYGRRWHKDTISYLKAQANVLDIIQSAKAAYKDLPIICLGESLGANLALIAAESKPYLVDGIILSSPALKTRIHLAPKCMVGGVDMVVGLIKTDTTVDLSPYMRAYASEDPAIIKDMLNDPLEHRQLKCQDIWDSYNSMKPIFKEASLLNKTIPVLIMQGKKDKILNPKAIINLVSSLNSDDLTVKWFKDRGHTMLEVNQPKTDILQTIDDWCKSHIEKQSLITIKTNTPASVPVTSSLPPLSQAILNAGSNSN